MIETYAPSSIAFLGNYLPRRCGIATFTHDLCEAVAAAAPLSRCLVGAVNDAPNVYAYPTRVHFELDEQALDSYLRAASFLNDSNVDLLCLQHEFGIYGGRAGSHILALLRAVRMPVVTTLHTVLAKPTVEQRRVMDELLDRSDRVVVMARKGVEILQQVYAQPQHKIDLIPHGILDIAYADSRLFKSRFDLDGRSVLLTFGLLGPGKGIEHAIEALPEIVARHPEVVYLVLGATHPHLLAREGERYRRSLEQLASDRGVREHVRFYDRFVSSEELKAFIGATDIYLTPYLNEAQITSGTLAYVFGAGKAVVSTPYWHARELLADGRGVLVPFRDPKAIAVGVSTLLDDPATLQRTGMRAHAVGRSMIWPAVAERYLESFRAARDQPRRASSRGQEVEGGHSLVLPVLRLGHIERMSDETGIFQHAIYTVPNLHEGYCTDDNARAFLLCNMLRKRARPRRVEHLATRYLGFLAAAFDEKSGRFRNFMSHTRAWLDDIGSEDSHGRALWSLGVGSHRARSEGHRRLAGHLFERAFPAVETFTSPRAWAFASIGIDAFLRGAPEHVGAQRVRALLLDRLLACWHACQSETWSWFEHSLTYDNARLSQAMLASGYAMQRHDALEVGLRSLRWLVTQQLSPEGNFRPIGSNGFYVQGAEPALFDQQPVEAQATVSACLEAYRVTLDATWKLEANRAFEWFLGRNDLGVPVYDEVTGGCGDGLHSDRVNANQGAESSLAFHLARAELKLLEHRP